MMNSNKPIHFLILFVLFLPLFLGLGLLVAFLPESKIHAPKIGNNPVVFELLGK